MCLVIDANKLSDFLKNPPTADTRPILAWMSPGAARRQRRGHAAATSGGRGGVVVYSTVGKFASEVSRAARGRLDELRRAGRARFCNESELQRGLRRVARKHMVSDDPHILALAAFSGARVIYTADAKLMEDFRNKRVMGDLAGKIYSGRRTQNLLRPDMCDHLCG